MIHHILSNDTYRLTELPGALVEYLHNSGPKSITDIAAYLRVDTSDIADILMELSRLHLVTCPS